MLILSIFGIVALSGVVVNNSLLLIDLINRNQAQGMAILAAVNEAGRRPIIFTSLTTFTCQSSAVSYADNTCWPSVHPADSGAPGIMMNYEERARSQSRRRQPAAPRRRLTVKGDTNRYDDGWPRYEEYEELLVAV